MQIVSGKISHLSLLSFENSAKVRYQEGVQSAHVWRCVREILVSSEIWGSYTTGGLGQTAPFASPTPAPLGGPESTCSQSIYITLC